MIPCVNHVLILYANSERLSSLPQITQTVSGMVGLQALAPSVSALNCPLWRSQCQELHKCKDAVLVKSPRCFP